jgi:hypothetical protein
MSFVSASGLGKGRLSWCVSPWHIGKDQEGEWIEKGLFEYTVQDACFAINIGYFSSIMNLAYSSNLVLTLPMPDNFFSTKKFE